MEKSPWRIVRSNIGTLERIPPTGLVSILTRVFPAAIVFSLLLATASTNAASLGSWPQSNIGKPSKTYVTGVAYGNGVWVIVGQKGFIATSPDGLKWTKRSAGISRDFNGVAFTGTRFVAVAKVTEIGAPEAKIFISDEKGTTWSPRNTDSGVNSISEGLHGVAADGMGTVVAVGGAWSSRITVSHDHGNTWSAKNLADFGGPWGKLYSVAYGAGKWMAVGFNTVLLSSDSGSSWSKISSDHGSSVAYGNGRWLRVDENKDFVYWSPVGAVSWTKASIGDAGGSDFGGVRGSAFYDGLFVVVGEWGNIWTSETGRNFKEWTASARVPSGGDMICVGGGERGFMAGGVDYIFRDYYGAVWPSPRWMRARLGSTWDYPHTVFDTDDEPQRKIGLPQYRVNTSSLNLLLEGTLFYMETLGAPVNLRLVYNSAPTKDNADTIGLFGKNWKFRYESMIGQFGAEAKLITGGGRLLVFTTPHGEDLSTATPANPITLVPPDGVFDNLVFYGNDQYFELTEKASKNVFRYAVSGGPGNSIWRLTRITDRNGNEVNFEVDGNSGRITRITDPSNRQVLFTYDNTQNLCTRIDVPGGRTILFEYNGDKTLTKITDMAGYQADYTYDDLGFITQMTVAGRTTRFTYAKRPGYEDKASLQDNVGDQILASVIDSSGGVTRYEVQTDGTVKRTDRKGLVTVFGSDKGQTSSVVDPLGNFRKMTFSDIKLPDQYQDSKGNITEFEYDERGNLLKTTDALGNVTTYTYDQRDNVTSMRDALGHTTSYQYDSKDRLISVTTPLGHTTNITYLANGRVSKVRDARGNESEFTYNASGDLLTAKDPLGHTHAFTYNSAGLAVSCTDPSGETKEFTYDNNDRLTESKFTTVPGSPKTQNAYDAFGQISATNPLGETITVTRNEFGFPTLVTDPLGNSASTEYDPSNNPVKITDPLGRVTTTTYDSADRPLVVTDPSGKQTERKYDQNGNLLEFSDTKKNKTEFAYDANNRLISTTDANGKKTSVTRDSLGRITVSTNARGQQVRAVYDADGRITSREFKESSGGFLADATFTRDANGNVLTMTDQWGTTTFTYDQNNRVTQINYPTGKSASFTYNSRGLPASITYPNGLVVTYLYDKFCRVASPNIARSGNLVGNEEPGNRVTLLQLTTGGGSKSISYTYNTAARPVLVNRPDSAPDTVFTYDAAGRMVSMTHSVGASDVIKREFVRDAAGNIVSINSTGTWLLDDPLPEPAKMSFDKCNQLTNRNGLAYTHDADGNLVAIAQNRFAATFNPENRPLTITRPSGGAQQTVTYTYDGNGMRVKRAVTGGDTTQFHYGPGGKLLFTTDGAGTVLTCFVWKENSLAAILGGTNLATDLYFPLTNHMGSISALAGLDGNSYALLAYEPYGKYVQPVGSGDPGLFTFAGALGVEDEGNGLFYMKNRFYDANSGRFIQRDPAGLGGGSNLYAYAMANPVHLVDPSGLGGMPWDDDPGMNPQAMEEAQRQYDYWEENGGWANRPRPAPIDPGSYEAYEKNQSFVLKSVWNWVPFSDFVNGGKNLWQGNAASATWDIGKGLLGPAGSAIGQVELIDERLGNPGWKMLNETADSAAKKVKECEDRAIETMAPAFDWRNWVNLYGGGGSSYGF